MQSSTFTRRLRATLVLSLAAVASCGSYGSPTPRPTPPADLPGTSWELGVQGGSAPASDVQPTLVFGSDGTLSGNDSCDNYQGTFTTDGSTITIAGLTTTDQAECAPETVAIATAFRDALGASTSWRATTADDLPLPSGIQILSPVKLVLSGAEDLIFSQD